MRNVTLAIAALWMTVSPTAQATEATMETTTIIGNLSTEDLRRDLQEERAPDQRRRRWIIGLALLAMACMAYATMFQNGLIGHLVDPPGRIFDSDHVNSSARAYKYGVPDAAVDLVMLSLVVLLAAMGGADRGVKLPIIPVALLVLASAQGGGAIFYFREMMKLGVICIYCVVTAAAHVMILALIIPEGLRAVRTLLHFTGTD